MSGLFLKHLQSPEEFPVGLEYVKWASENVDITLFAIGSIEPDNTDEVIKAGASRIAVVRAIMNSEILKKILKSFL